jgi:hypothetical protein
MNFKHAQVNKAQCPVGLYKNQHDNQMKNISVFLKTYSPGDVHLTLKCWYEFTLYAATSKTFNKTSKFYSLRFQNRLRKAMEAIYVFYGKSPGFLSNYPSSLSKNEHENPLQVIKQFFQQYRPGNYCPIIQRWVGLILNSDDGKATNIDGRLYHLSFFNLLIKLLDEVFLYHGDNNKN